MRTGRILQRRHSAVGGVWRGELGRAIEDRWREAARFWDGGRQKGRLWALGFFKCSSSNVSLSITSPFGPSIF